MVRKVRIAKNGWAAKGRATEGQLNPDRRCRGYPQSGVRTRSNADHNLVRSANLEKDLLNGLGELATPGKLAAHEDPLSADDHDRSALGGVLDQQTLHQIISLR